MPLTLDDLIDVEGPEQEAPGSTHQQSQPSGSSGSRPEDTSYLARFVATYLPDAVGPQPWKQGGQIWKLPVCPFNADHNQSEAYVAQLPGGQLSFGCHRNGCKDKKWQQLRAKYDPEYATRQTVTPINPLIFGTKSMQAAALAQMYPSRPVLDLVPDAPVGSNAVTPAGWDVDAQGVTHGTEAVCLAPIFVVARQSDISTSDQYLTVAWLEDDRWRQHTAVRDVFLNARKVIDLAAKGFPVSSANASPLAKYLQQYEAINLRVIPRTEITRRMGWQGRDLNAFVCGNRVVSSDGRDLQFDPADDGSAQISNGFTTAGDLQHWIEAMSLVRPFPRVAFGVYASLATPFLRLFDVDTFTVDWSYSTSTGKTTTLSLGASVWGDPKALVSNWSSSRVYVERAAAMLNGLPVILDETKQGKDGLEIAKIIYDLSTGHGRGRGTITGLQQTGSWRTIALTSGEYRITDATVGDSGTRTRVISLWGQPFGSVSNETANLIAKLKDLIEDNHGHAGLAVLDHLMQSQDEWSRWKEQFREARDRYQARLAGAVGAGRFSAYFAVIEIAAQQAHRALALNWDYQPLLDAVFEDAIAGLQGADRGAEALRQVASWAHANQHLFWPRSNEYSRRVGRWDDDASWERLAFFSSELESVLKNFSFEPQSTINGWKDRGWLECGADRTTKLVRIGKEERTWMIVIRRTAIEEAQNVPASR